MGFADQIRIMLGKLTPGEIAERDAAARAEREATERQIAQDEADREARKAQQSAAAESNRKLSADHERRMEVSAGIAALQIVCHKDAWRWLLDRMNEAQYYAWETGATQVQERQGHVLAVRLSGPKLVEVLHRLAVVRKLPGVERPYGTRESSTTDRVTAVRMYDVIAAVVDQVDPGNPKGELPPAVLDDRPGAKHDED